MNMEELRALRDEALSELGGSNSIAAQYERGAVQMGWEGLTGERADSETDTLLVELRGLDKVGSYAAGKVSTSLQNAVACIGRFQRNPRVSAQSSITRAERERFEIVQEAQIGGTLVFRVPAIPIESLSLEVGKYPAVAGRAVKELIDTLPRTDNDGWTVDGVLGAPPLIRRAVHDLSKAATFLPEGIAMNLTPERGQAAIAELSHQRADQLRRDLDLRNDIVGSETHTGLLDGLRGTRRVFYLIEDDEAEIAGAVDSELVADVEALEHQRVHVRLETTQWVKKNGRLGRKAYRLLAIEPAPVQEQLDTDPTSEGPG